MNEKERQNFIKKRDDLYKSLAKLVNKQSRPPSATAQALSIILAEVFKVIAKQCDSEDVARVFYATIATLDGFIIDVENKLNE